MSAILLLRLQGALYLQQAELQKCFNYCFTSPECNDWNCAVHSCGQGSAVVIPVSSRLKSCLQL
jgi:hypothetical protein